MHPDQMRKKRHRGRHDTFGPAEHTSRVASKDPVNPGMSEPPDNRMELEALAASVVTEAAIDASRSDTWSRFWRNAQPLLERWVRSHHFLGRLSQREDHRRDIVILTWEKLQDNNYNKLRAYFTRQRANRKAAPAPPRYQRPGGFESWLFRVFKNIAIDYMRQLPEYMRRPSTVPPSGQESSTGPADQTASNAYWHAVVTLHSGDDLVLGSLSSAATAHELLDFLDSSISPRLRQAAALHQQGKTYQAIARAIGLPDESDAERVVRRSRDRLAYRPAMELWSQNYSDIDIARALGLDGPEHAVRVVKAATELLKRKFRL